LHGGQSGKRSGAIPSASSHRHSPCGRRRTPAARPPTSGRLPLAQARMQRVGLASTFRLRRSRPIFSPLPILWGGVPHHSLPPSLLSWFVTPTQSSVVGPGFFLRSDPPRGGYPPVTNLGPSAVHRGMMKSHLPQCPSTAMTVWRVGPDPLPGACRARSPLPPSLASRTGWVDSGFRRHGPPLPPLRRGACPRGYPPTAHASADGHMEIY